MARGLQAIAMFLVPGVVFFFFIMPAPAQRSVKFAIPPKDAMAKAEILIHELYRDELAKAEKDALAKGRLAAVFLQEGKETTDDPAGRFVLLEKARQLASEAGDGPTALQAIEELAQDYQLPPRAIFQMKIKAMHIASTAAASPDAYHTVYDGALALLDDALAIDDFPASLELLQTAENAAKKLRNVSLVSSLRHRKEDVLALQKEFVRWQPFADRLAKDPADAEANAEMGLYNALVKGNWDAGLPLLVKGSNPRLQAAAKLDSADPREPAKQAEVGDRWYEAAKDFKDRMHVNALLRAYYWYQQAAAADTTAESSLAQKRLASIMELLPAEYRIGDIVTELKRCEGHQGPVYAAAFSPDGRRIVSGGADGSVRIWDARSGKEQRKLDGHNSRVWTVAFAPDSRRVASAGFDNSIRIWDLVAGREIRRLPGHSDYVRSVAFGHEGNLLLSGGDDRLVRLWNIADAKEIRAFPGHNHFVWSVALSRDGRHALSGSLDRTVRLWDVDSGTELKKLEGHSDTVLSVAFSPNGRLALSGSTDKTLKLWDLETGKDIRTFVGHEGYVHSVAYSPDGRHVLSGSQDGTVRLWDAHTGKELHKLLGHRDPVWSVAFSRDGRFAVSAGEDKTVRIWGGR